MENSKTKPEFFPDIKIRIFRFPGGIISLALVLLLMALNSCKDKIYSFDVMPRTIGPYDSVITSYNVKGTAKLMVHDGTPVKTDTIWKYTRHYVLDIPGKSDNDVFQPIDVTVFPGEGIDVMAFDTIRIHGDTLVSKIKNDSIRWSGPFLVDAVKNASGRTVTIIHDKKQLDTLAAGKTDPVFFKGSAITGNWELRTLKTPAEKAGTASVPHFIILKVTLKHKPYTYEH